VLDVVFFDFAMSQEVGQVWEEGKESKRKIDLLINKMCSRSITSGHNSRDLAGHVMK
jgi:hypothetical protein